MTEKTKGLIEIHIAILLLSFIALFAKLIHLPPTIIILGRAFFASVALFIILKYSKQNLLLKSTKDYIYLIILGLIFAIHMVAFFQSAQVSTVAVALVIFYTYPVFITILEPYFSKEKIGLPNLALALIVFIGVALIIPEYKLENDISQSVLFGFISSLTFAVVAIANKKHVKHYSSQLLAFYQFGISTIVLLPFIFIENFIISPYDIILLISLGVVFTVGGYTLFISAMKYLKAQKVGIIAGLEPVYGTIWALLILGEIPQVRTILGGLIILVASLYATFSKKS